MRVLKYSETVCGVAAIGTTDGLASCDPKGDLTSQGVAGSSATCGLPGPVEPIPGASLLLRHPRATDQSPLIRKKSSRNERRKAVTAANAALATSHSAEKADNAGVASFDGVTTTAGEPAADDMLEEQVLLASSVPDEQVEVSADL
jgi:hypothetical protein